MCGMCNYSRPFESYNRNEDDVWLWKTKTTSIMCDTTERPDDNGSLSVMPNEPKKKRQIKRQKKDNRHKTGCNGIVCLKNSVVSSYHS